MSIKAAHLEAVSNNKTEAFLAAQRRFFARRDKSSHIYSDNGINFIGTTEQVDKHYATAIKNNSELPKILGEDKIQ